MIGVKNSTVTRITNNSRFTDELRPAVALAAEAAQDARPLAPAPGGVRRFISGAHDRDDAGVVVALLRGGGRRAERGRFAINDGNAKLS